MLEVSRTPSDDPRFRALVAELDAELWQRYGDVQAQYAPHNVIEELATVVIACEADRALGCGCFKAIGAGTVELKRMFVTPAARGRGVAKRIVGELEGWARESGVTAMVLETGPNNPEAIALYGKLGYRRIDRFGPYTDMPTSICMAKQLADRR